VPSSSSPALRTPERAALATTAFVFFAVHAWHHLVARRFGALLWASSLETLLLGIGCLAASRRIVSVCLLVLGLCAGLWIVDLAATDHALDTAVLTHVGAFAVAAVAAWRIGYSRGAWRLACAWLVLLFLASRAFTPPELNVNLAFAVLPGWESRFGSHAFYLALLGLVAAASFWALESLFTRPALLDRHGVPLILALAILLTWALARHVQPSLASACVVLCAALAIRLLESVRPEQRQHTEPDRPLLEEIGHLLLNYQPGYLLALGGCALCARALRALDVPSFWPTSWPLILQVVFGMLVAEGVSYWQHRWAHRSPWLWRFHALHHSGERLNVLRAGRFHWIDIATGSFLVFAPLVILGAPELVIGLMGTLAGAAGLLQHANLRMRTPRWLDRLFCTPAVHRVHHSRDAREADGNFGTSLMLFDQLFGTFRAPEKPSPSAFGIERDRTPPTFWRSLGVRAFR
jgi:sterol desaturase/sphingolipid hydroxylase (fatty acid hydroxylase superfamily)